MPGRLEGQLAIVTGSTQGFGKGILDLFVKEGAAVLGLDLQASDSLVEGYSEKQAYQLQADVTQESTWQKAVCPSSHFPDPSPTHPSRLGI